MTQHRPARKRSSAGTLRRKQTAAHEAGHAVVGIILGLHVRCVRIGLHRRRPGWLPRGAGGVCRFEKPNPTAGAVKAGAVLALNVSSFAGLAAEHVLCGMEYAWEEGPAKHGAWADYDSVVGLLPYPAVSAEASDQAIAASQEFALALVKIHRQTIERVASLLAERGSLTGADVESMVSEHGRLRVAGLDSAGLAQVMRQSGA